MSYQWAETLVPLAERDQEAKDYVLEPLFDKELRYGHVRIIESTPSQLPDYQHRVFGNQAVEDYCFYRDGFGTRLLRSPAVQGSFQQVSEFIVLTSQGAYPMRKRKLAPAEKAAKRRPNQEYQTRVSDDIHTRQNETCPSPTND